MKLNTGYVQLALGMRCRINFEDEYKLISDPKNLRELSSSPNLN